MCLFPPNLLAGKQLISVEVAEASSLRNICALVSRHFHFPKGM